MRISYDRIRALPRFRDLPRDRVEWLSSRLIERRLRSGEIPLKQGEPAAVIFLVESGYIKWERHTQDGHPVILDVYGNCESIGELALTIGTAYPASAVTLCDSVVFQLDRLTYQELKTECREFRDQSMLCLASRNHSVFGRIESDGKHGVDLRISGFLGRLARKFAGPVQDGFYVLPFSLARRDVASAVGCRPETATRILSAWVKEGVIRFTDNSISIKADFEPRENSLQSIEFGSECTKCRRDLEFRPFTS